MIRLLKTVWYNTRSLISLFLFTTMLLLMPVVASDNHSSHTRSLSFTNNSTDKTSLNLRIKTNLESNNNEPDKKRQELLTPVVEDKLHELQDKIEELEEENTCLTNGNDKLTSENNNLIGELDSYKKNQDLLLDQCEKQKNDIEDLKNAVKELEVENDRLESEKKLLYVNKQEHSTKFYNEKSTTSIQSPSFSNSTDRKKDDNQCENCNNLKELNQHLEQQLKENEYKLHEQDKELKNCEKELNANSLQIENLGQEIIKYQEQNQELLSLNKKQEETNGSLYRKLSEYHQEELFEQVNSNDKEGSPSVNIIGFSSTNNFRDNSNRSMSTGTETSSTGNPIHSSNDTCKSNMQSPGLYGITWDKKRTSSDSIKDVIDLDAQIVKTPSTVPTSVGMPVKVGFLLIATYALGITLYHVSAVRSHTAPAQICYSQEGTLYSTYTVD